MGSIVDAISLHGTLVPYGGPFLVFSDYCRAAIRMAALMGIPVIYVFTHDSIGLGEDGPTHQPIEHVWSLRLIPNLDVFRPADALECAAAWAHTVLRTDGPTALCLTRQNVPQLERPADFDPDTILRGAYVLTSDAAPELTIVATGSEVGVAVGAKKLLNERGRQVRVVSAPCWDLFRRQPADYQAFVLPKGVRTVTLEAGVTTPWSEAGTDVIRLGIDRFGASGPYKELAEAYGLTPERVADSISKELA